uniref:NTF2 domain-containing protein n=1 Tax=Parascaris equorum TaxID=6256 RepID=A0A914R7V3_PAREQ
MTFNPNFEEIGNAFVQHYYTKFDVPDDGYDLQSLTFKVIQRAITKTDCQPLPDGSILVAVIGQLKVR